MFQESQNKEYLELCIDRTKNVELVWVEQFLDVIFNSVNSEKQLRLNDIGCNLGQFWKGLKKRGGNIKYRGYDFEEIYLDQARKLFPEISNKLFRFDIRLKIRLSGVAEQ